MKEYEYEKVVTWEEEPKGSQMFLSIVLFLISIFLNIIFFYIPGINDTLGHLGFVMIVVISIFEFFAILLLSCSVLLFLNSFGKGKRIVFRRIK